MGSQQAKVIDFNEFRRSRQARTTPVAAPVAPLVWLPIWVMVPVWSFR